MPSSNNATRSRLAAKMYDGRVWKESCSSLGGGGDDVVVVDDDDDEDDVRLQTTPRVPRDLVVVGSLVTSEFGKSSVQLLADTLVFLLLGQQLVLEPVDFLLQLGYCSFSLGCSVFSILQTSS